MSPRSLFFNRLTRCSLLAAALVASLEVSAAPQKKKKRNSGKSSIVKAQPVDESVRVMKKEGVSILQVVLNGSSEGLAEKLQSSLPDLVQYKNVVLAASDPYVNRVALFTGVSPWNSGIANDQEDWRWSKALRGHDNLFDLFYNKGFLTVLAGDGLFGSTGRETGIPLDHQLDAELVGEKTDATTLREIETFLKSPPSSPFLATVVLNDAKDFETNLQKLAAHTSAQPKLTLVVVGGESGIKKSKIEANYELFAAILHKGGAVDSERLASSVDWMSTLSQIAGIPVPTKAEGVSLLQGKGNPKRLVTGLVSAGEKPIFHVRSHGWVAFGSEDKLNYYSLDEQEQWSHEALEQESNLKLAVNTLPKSWAKTRRDKEEIQWDSLADGSVVYHLQAGDQLPSEEGPEIKERGVEVEVQFTYHPKSHANSVLLSHGNDRLGFAIHFVDGRPAVTTCYDGLQSTLKMKEPLKAGDQHLKVVFGVDGTLSIGSRLTVDNARGFTPFDGGFPRQPRGQFLVGFSGEVLSKEKFPKATGFEGKISDLYYGVLPGLTVETRAVKAVPVE